jgi:hypothetical protein
LQDRAVGSRANTDGAAAGDQSSTGRSWWCASNLVANAGPRRRAGNPHAHSSAGERSTFRAKDRLTHLVRGRAWRWGGERKGSYLNIQHLACTAQISIGLHCLFHASNPLTNRSVIDSAF